MTSECPHCKAQIRAETLKTKTLWRVLEVMTLDDGETAGLIEAKKPEETSDPHVASVSECSNCHKTILQLSKSVPRAVAADLEEGLLCFTVGAYNASTVMFRRTVERSANERGAHGRNLFEQIQSLRRLGKLTDSAEDWTHGVRLLGRYGAHAKDSAKKKAQERAEGTLLLTLAYIQAVYVEAPAEHVDEWGILHVWWGAKCVHGHAVETSGSAE